VNELPIPPDQDSDPEATEVLRVWIVNQQLECSLLTGAFEDPETWGTLLADVIRNVALALKEQDGKDPQETVERIVGALEQELNSDGEVEENEDEP
jgi:hypothetical protein